MADLKLFEEFMNDEHAFDFFITGAAGTGKTTDLAAYVSYVELQDIKHLVCAYTHKACGVLKTKLPSTAEISTLHSFLQKRPTINTDAKCSRHIESSAVFGESERPRLLFIDEFSMVGEQDLMDLRALQDPDYEGDPAMKIVWIGDPYQLPPVKDAEAVKPRQPYWIDLKKIHRSASDNPLQATIRDIVSMITKESPPAALERHGNFYESEDLIQSYKQESSNDKIFLAYTNQKVQEVNTAIAGKTSPDNGDRLFCGTVNKHYTFIRSVSPHEITEIDRFWDDPLGFNSKYKTLEFLISLDICEYYEVQDEDGEEFIYPVIFGTHNYLMMKQGFGQEATDANNQIEAKFSTKAAGWAKQNYHHPLARKRAKAWRQYLTLKDTVASMDFSYCTTVHKSQGSTYDSVFLDAEDLSKCSKHNFDLYLRLYYVAISRASNKVITN